MTAISNECGRAKEMARLSRDAKIPLIRDEVLSGCQTFNAGLNMLLMTVPDK